MVILGVALVYALGLASIEPSINSARPYPFIARERDLRYHPLLAPGVRHLAVLGAVFLVLVAGSYWLNNWELVYSNRGVVFGASATDMHAIYPANTIMAGVALVLAALLLLVAIRPTTGASTGFLVTAAAVPILWIATGFILGEIWPACTSRSPSTPTSWPPSDHTSKTTSSRRGGPWTSTASKCAT